jgi:hypothetical protein
MASNSDVWPSWFKPNRGKSSGDEDAQSATGGGHSTEPVKIWEAANLMEAHVIKSRLESEGIPAILRGEALGAIYGLTTGSLAVTTVWVPAPLVERALAILDDNNYYEHQEDEHQDEQEDGRKDADDPREEPDP